MNGRVSLQEVAVEGGEGPGSEIPRCLPILLLPWRRGEPNVGDDRRRLRDAEVVAVGIDEKVWVPRPSLLRFVGVARVNKRRVVKLGYQLLQISKIPPPYVTLITLANIGKHSVGYIPLSASLHINGFKTTSSDEVKEGVRGRRVMSTEQHEWRNLRRPDCDI